MTVFLLDANVLIALLDPGHVFHARAERWFADHCGGGWATCPLTENAVVRILGNPRYPRPPGSPTTVAAALREMVASPGHVFWADDISLLDANRIDASRLRTTGQITDTYLLALAVARGGRLATFDRRLAVDAVVGSSDALLVIAVDGVPA